MGTTGSQVGTGVGMAAGAAFGGPMGAAVGGALGGAVGGMFDSEGNPYTPPDLQQYGGIGAVQGTYGGSYVDPVTGRVVYASNTNTPTMQSYQDQQTYNQLMGYGGGTSELDQRIKSQQATLDALKKQGAGSVKLSDFLPPEWIGKDGNVVNPQDYINKRGADNPLWAAFMRDTGGNYGSDNPDISFSKWSKDIYSRNVAPKLADYGNAEKTAKGNQAVYDQQVRDAESQLEALSGIKSQISGGGQTTNPMLSYLEHGPNQSNYIAQQMTDQYGNAMNQANQQLASRGVGASSMSELAHAQGANQLATGILGGQVTGAQNNFNDRLKMLSFLQGNKAQEQANQVSTGGLYNQQMGMGQAIGTHTADMNAAQNAAQQGMNLQAGFAGQAADQARSAANQNAWGSAVGAIGQYAGQKQSNDMMKAWLSNQNRMGTQQSSPTSGGTAGGGLNWWETN